MDFLLDFINQYGIAAIFFAVMLEYACVPIPSEVVLPLAGAMAVQGKTNFVFIWLLSIIAGILGSLICYIIGRTGGVALLDKIADRYPKTKDGLRASHQKFNKYSALAVGITRVVPLCRTYISFVAGAGKQSVLSFILSSSLGIAFWNFALVGLGYTLGSNWTVVGIYYEKFKIMLIPIIALAVVGIAIYILIKTNKDKKS